MNAQPVIARELLAQSRQPATYWLRVVGAAVAMVVFALGANGPTRPGQQLGEYLFDALNAAAYHIILLCVPLLTADSISREKREGTLGLLFLTPLRATDIVLGKAISQALRGSTLLIALVPVLLLPVLLGGVGWRKALATVCIHSSAFSLALVSGLIVSSLAERPVRAALGAVLFALVAVAPLNLLLAVAFNVDLWPPLFLPVGWLPTTPVIGMGTGIGLSLTLLIGATLAATLGGLWQAARQVALFWQAAESSTDRLRAAAGMWLRIIGIVAFATQAILAVSLVNRGAGVVSIGLALTLNLPWLLPLPLLAAAVCVNRLAARAGDPSATRHSGWRFFWLWTFVSAALPLTAALIEPGGSSLRLAFMAANAALIASLGLSAGTLAFAWRRRWATALVWCLVFSVVLTAAGLAVLGAAAFWRAEILLQDTGALADSPLSQWLMSPVLGLALVVTGSPEFLSTSGVFSDIPASHHGLLAGMVTQNSAALAALAVVAAFALPRVLARRLRAGPATHAADESRALRHDFCEPLVGRNWFRLRQRLRLQVNPIGWLHARQWSARLTGWGWCLAAVITQVPVFAQLRGIDSIVEQQAWLFVALQAGVAFAAAGSFQREKLSGVLELILVTPITARQIVQGRWAALVRQFLPTLVLMALLLGLSSQMLWFRPADMDSMIAAPLAALPMISTPLIGLYMSLRLRSVMGAWLATCGVSLAVSAAALAITVGVLWVLAKSRSPLLEALQGASGWSNRHWALLGILLLPSLVLQVAVARYTWRRLVAGLASRRLVLP